jgi:hypothetical protein
MIKTAIPSPDCSENPDIAYTKFVFLKNVVAMADCNEKRENASIKKYD